jgi:hypothetical protein
LEYINSSDLKKLEQMKSDIDYTKTTGVERSKGLRPIMRRVYLRLHSIPFVGKTLRIFLGMYRSYWTSQKTNDLENEIARLKERVRLLEK